MNPYKLLKTVKGIAEVTYQLETEVKLHLKLGLMTEREADALPSRFLTVFRNAAEGKEEELVKLLTGLRTTKADLYNKRCPSEPNKRLLARLERVIGGLPEAEREKVRTEFHACKGTKAAEKLLRRLENAGAADQHKLFQESLQNKASVVAQESSQAEKVNPGAGVDLRVQDLLARASQAVTEDGRWLYQRALETTSRRKKIRLLKAALHEEHKVATGRSEESSTEEEGQ